LTQHIATYLFSNNSKILRIRIMTTISISEAAMGAIGEASLIVTMVASI
jgi:hypothetical protein